MTTYPALFISHGSPMIALEPSPARDFLLDLGKRLGKPKAILVMSAHFEAREACLTSDARPAMIYDFGGFPRPLYDMRYDAPGSPELAARAGELLTDAGFKAYRVENRGFDHGTWVPLKLMYPAADIPVVQLSVEPMKDGAHHLAGGKRRHASALTQQNRTIKKEKPHRELFLGGLFAARFKAREQQLN